MKMFKLLFVLAIFCVSFVSAVQLRAGSVDEDKCYGESTWACGPENPNSDLFHDMCVSTLPECNEMARNWYRAHCGNGPVPPEIPC